MEAHLEQIDFSKHLQYALYLYNEGIKEYVEAGSFVLLAEDIIEKAYTWGCLSKNICL